MPGRVDLQSADSTTGWLFRFTVRAAPHAVNPAVLSEVVLQPRRLTRFVSELSKSRTTV